MARLRHQQPIQVKSDSSFGKWVFILILCGAAVGGYLKRDMVMEKVHDFVHGAPPPAEAPPPPPPIIIAAPAPAPAPVPVATPDNPCGAFANDAVQMSICKDQMAKIQRMKDDAAARDKAFQAPTNTTTNTTNTTTNTTGH